MKAYKIYCSTGCSCCSNQNHYRGPFKTRERADQAAEMYHASRLLASQYAKNGRYEVMEVESEVLPDGRVIIDGSYVSTGFVEDIGNDMMYDLR